MKNKLRKIFFPIGIVLIITGIILIVFTFHHEVLDNKYIIKNITEYTPKSNKNLEEGELTVLKNTKYIGEGIYEITYTNHAKTTKNKKLLEPNTSFNITDLFGNGYELITSKISVNNKEYEMKNNYLTSNEGINIDYQNNILDIEIPSNIVLEKNTISIQLKLTGREEKIKYITSQDAYYSFIPSIENNFYGKKISQAYVIEGYGYIELEKK